MLAERGLTTYRETPTLLDRDLVADVDVVITMGCGEPSGSGSVRDSGLSGMTPVLSQRGQGVAGTDSVGDDDLAGHICG